MHAQNQITRESNPYASLVASLVGHFPLLGKLLTMHGTFNTITWERPIETADVANAGKLTKETVCSSARFVDYNARALVNEMRESGELPANPQPKKGFVYVQFPVLAQAIKSGHFYAVLTPRAECSYSVTFRFAGQPISKPAALALMSDKARADATSERHGPPLQLNIALPYLRAVG